MAIDDQTVPAGHDPKWLVELQGVLLSTDGLESFLSELASLTVRALPAVAACGVTLQPNGRARTVAASGVLATQVDEIQYSFNDGPCLDAMRTGNVNYVPDLGRETQWPDFCMAALGYGVRSVLSTPLRVLDRSAGALNLYATTTDAFDATARARAFGFAGHASGAVALAMRPSRCRSQRTCGRRCRPGRSSTRPLGSLWVNNTAPPRKRSPYYGGHRNNATSRSTPSRPASWKASAVCHPGRLSSPRVPHSRTATSTQATDHPLQS